MDSDQGRSRPLHVGEPLTAVAVSRAWANIIGTTGAPFDAHLTLRGLRTLFARMECQQTNAMAVAAFLARHRLVAGRS
jgi:cystathionine gamma-synthase